LSRISRPGTLKRENTEQKAITEETETGQSRFFQFFCHFGYSFFITHHLILPFSPSPTLAPEIERLRLFRWRADSSQARGDRVIALLNFAADWDIVEQRASCVGIH